MEMEEKMKKLLFYITIAALITIGMVLVKSVEAWEPMPCDTQLRIEQTVEVQEVLPKLLYNVSSWLWIEDNVVWSYQNSKVPFDGIERELVIQMKATVKAKDATKRLIKKMCKGDKP